MALLKPSTSIYKTIVRTLTPWAIGAVVWVAQRLGFHVNAGTATEVAASIGLALTLIVPPLEKKFPWMGVFLGWIGAPTWTANTSKAQLAAQLAALEVQLAGTQGPTPGTPVAVTLTPYA